MAISSPFKSSPQTTAKPLKKTDRLIQGTFLQHWLGMCRLLDSGMQPIKGI
jgi:hypothetical protein